MIIGIVAIAKNRAIGKNGKLPWHYSDDLKFFKRTTTGNAVVMGSNTWDSIGKPLPARLNIVLTRTRQLDVPPEVVVLKDKRRIIELADKCKGDIFIIGGAQIFASFANDIERWYVTDIPMVVDDADVFMPEDFLDRFEEVDSRELGDGLRVRTLDRC
jgi:dihydrofolate reductase